MIGVIGAGAMGGALAIQLARAGRAVTVLTTPFDAAVVDAHRAGEPHPALGVRMPGDATLVEEDGWKDALPDAEVLVVAVATVGLVSTVRTCVPHTSGTEVWAIATKGWDADTKRSAAGVVAHELGDPSRVVAVVGPSLASEIAQGVPTGVVCASEGPSAARRIAELLDSTHFRTYTSEDVAGVEVGAIMKNVIAIAIGMCDGLAPAFGVDAMTNAKAFVFSRGLVEMARMARALGGKAETVLGLSGAGDLFVTALGGRNGRFGALVGSGIEPEAALEQMATTVEGYVNVRTASAIADEHGLDLPIVRQVAKVLFEGLPPREAIERLVSAPVEEEL